ncbi:MAG: NAD(P)-dependent oxidoreductase [candidate division Zixibacteria bacterium]|nr:NAD(P)-dependent oxidoreductase [candidate division Zixibacteria bacterium]MDD5425086.1 NAD(P)-dependent oxidoreductase [candidate division Zixibacteria bacterium]
MKTGFIGMGTLGRVMAERLISEGASLIVWNRTLEKTRGLKATTAETPASLITSSEIVFLNLFDSVAVREVLTGKNGLLAGDCTNKIIIDTTTNHYDAVPAFYEACQNAGAAYLEAPVLGSVVPASKGALTILVSGQEDAYLKARPYLEKLGQHIFFLEKPTLVTKMKLVNNLLLGTFMTSLAEAVVLGEKIGLERGKVLEILAVGAGNSGILNAKKQKLLDEDFSPHFAAATIYKDLNCLEDLARSLKHPLVTGTAAREIFALTTENKTEHLDFSVVYKILKAGVRR